MCTLFTFSLLLRIGEALRGRWRDLLLPPRGGLHQEGSFYIPRSKTGRDQYVPITSPSMIEILRRFKERCSPVSPDDFIFSFGYSFFRKVFTLAIEVLLLPIGIWRTHSLRRGGATKLLMDTHSPEYCAVVGRWKSLTSCRRYLRAGEALTARLLASLAAKTLGRVAALQMSIDQLFD